MMVGEHSLFNHYKTNSDLIHQNIFSLSELDEMLPFERDVYIQLHNVAVEKKG